MLFLSINLITKAMEVEINNRRIKYEDGKVYSYIKNRNSKVFKWYILKGYINNGYRRIKINKKIYKYSRVKYKLYNPEWDIEDRSMNNFIDHLDGNTFNDNIENLRSVTNQQNMWNQVNAKGYYWVKNRNKYKSTIGVNNKYIHLGYFDNETDAHNAYLDAKKIYHKIE